MIDEKKLLERLGIWYGSLFPRTSIQDSIKCDVIDNVMTMIEDAEKVDEWISVNERLPEPEDDVIVTCRSCRTGKKYVGTDYRSCKTGEWSYFGEDVIAWQPLSEPYREGGGVMQK